MDEGSGASAASAVGGAQVRAADLRIPERHGEVLCVPPRSAWLGLAARNAASLDHASMDLSDLPLGELRRQTRKDLLGAAGAFLARVGAAPDGLPEGPLVVTGHQPLFFHPGIWVKNLLVDSCVREGAAGLNLIVDTDDFEDIGVALPRRDGRLEVVHRSLVRRPPDVPFEAVPPPSAANWARFVDGVRAEVQTLGNHALTERVDRLAAAGARARAVAEHLGEFMALVRRGFEGAGRSPRYGELPVSAMSRTRAFRCFAMWILRHHETFRECHNRALDAHREQEGIRSAAQPFPNLRLDGEGCELPFWVVRDGRRWPASAVRRGDVIRVRAQGHVVTTVSAKETDPEALAATELRPRALTLTMFVRLCFADLFVHGIGGGQYDRATDRLIAELFGVRPPLFAVASGTFHLPLGRHANPRADRLALERRRLDLQHNPDRFLNRGDETVSALVAEKWERIRQLESDSLTRRQRREITQRIRAINQALARHLEDEIRAIDEELQVIAVEETEHEIATLRTYPFFLFDPEELRAAVRAACGVPQT
ncbi:MAG: hypothetical protein QN163_08915 [Armatimonadota bacterium]|nr:hypothetical protein [Armatimonadota bacterium]MDR5697723.1 hypothetical protein [Armatimonadota bacterium]